MGINDNLDEGFRPFSLNPESRDYLIQSARWAKIISIVTFISMLVGFLATVLFFSFGGLMLGERSGVDSIGFLFGFYGTMIFFFVFIGIIPFYWLYKFSTETKGRLVDNKTTSLSVGINHLKSFFKTIVIFGLVVIVLYAVGFLFILA